jgi:hypothetical protein
VYPGNLPPVTRLRVQLIFYPLQQRFASQHHLPLHRGKGI